MAAPFRLIRTRVTHFGLLLFATFAFGLALAGPAGAGNRTVTGTDGLAGADGAPGEDGENGRFGGFPTATEAIPGDAADVLRVTGGAGGAGGRGGDGDADSPDGGNGGDGGAGGNATAIAIGDAASQRVEATAIGGRGGDGGLAGAPADGGTAGVPGNAGRAGAATASASYLDPVEITEGTSRNASATATGGNGGNSPTGFRGTNGGTAFAESHATATGAGTLRLSVSQRGGNGGNGLERGGFGADSIAHDQVSGAATGSLNISQTTQGGRGGNAFGDSGLSGFGGDAESVLEWTGARSGAGAVDAFVSALGGAGGGSGTTGTGGRGGSAYAAVDVEGGLDVSARGGASGGLGGSGLIGADGTAASLGPIRAHSTGDGDVRATASLSGGSGGDGFLRSGSGADAVLENAVFASTAGRRGTIALSQFVSAGNAGSSLRPADSTSPPTLLGTAGNATNVLVTREETTGKFFVDLRTLGGRGSSIAGVGLKGVRGGDANALGDATNPIGSVIIDVHAQGGLGHSGIDGADSSDGGDARSESRATTETGAYFTNASSRAIGGSAGSFDGLGGATGGHGGDAESIAEARAVAESHVEAIAYAQGGFGGSFSNFPNFSQESENNPYGNGGSGGDAKARAFGENTGRGEAPVLVSATAYGGHGSRGNGVEFAGGSGGSAFAEAEGRSIDRAVFVDALATPANGVPTWQPGGRTGDGGRSEAKSLAISETGAAHATAQALHASGDAGGFEERSAARAEAKSGGTISGLAQSLGFDGRSSFVDAMFSVADDAARGGAKHGLADVGGNSDGPLPSLASLANYTAAAVGRRAPSTTDTASLIAGNAHAESLFGPTGNGATYGLGMLAANRPADASDLDIVLESELVFGFGQGGGLATENRILIALLDASFLGADPDASAVFEILRDGVVVSRHVLTASSGDADALDDQIFALSVIPRFWRVGFRLTMTSADPGAGFRLGLAFGAGEFAGATPIPEPGVALLAGLGLMCLASGRRRARRG